MKKSKYIDHTILKATATKEDIKKLCNEAILHDFMSVCVNPANVSYAHELLKNSDVLVCTVIGFPLGANTTKVKVFETKDAISNGAQEIDMVINVAKAKEHDYEFIKEEIKEVKEACGSTLLKVIIETCYLTKDEIKNCSLMVKEANADYVKTSTGFGTGGALVEDVKIMRDAVGPNIGVKASGGVRTAEDFEKMIEAGATRIGTSNGCNLV